MDVPNSEVGYTIATTRRETTKVHKNMWWHWRKKNDNKNEKPACAKRTYIHLYFAGVHIQLWDAFKNCLMIRTSHSLSTVWVVSCSYSQPLKTNNRTCNKVRLCFRSKLYGLNWIESRHFSQRTTLPLLRDERSLYACRKWTQTHCVVGKWPATFRNFQCQGKL